MQTLTEPASVASSETAEIALPIVGMTCASCVNRIDRFLRKADGVSEVSVNLATESATIRYLPELTGAADLARVISNAGYEVPTAALDLAGRANEGEREAAREAMEATRVAAREREKRALASLVELLTKRCSSLHSSIARLARLTKLELQGSDALCMQHLQCFYFAQCGLT